MDDLLVDRGAKRGRKPVISLEGRTAPVLAGHVFGDAVELQRRDAWLTH